MFLGDGLMDVKAVLRIAFRNKMVERKSQILSFFSFEIVDFHKPRKANENVHF